MQRTNPRCGARIRAVIVMINPIAIPKFTKTVLLALIISTASLSAAIPKPNIVYFLVDDMGYADAGFSGSTEFKTPNMDKLAEIGAVLTDFYAQLVCSPW